MSLLNPDFNRPMSNDNRDEYILVDFHRALKNTNMCILKNLFKAAIDDPEIVKIFPQLMNATSLSIDQQYDFTAIYSPIGLLRVLSNGKLSDTTLQSYVENLMEPMELEYLHTTRIQMILREFLQHDFTKKIYIRADNWTNEMSLYVYEMFKDMKGNDRITAVEGSLEDCLRDYFITTAFISDSDSLHQVIVNEPDLVKGRMFIIIDGMMNLESENAEEGKTDYKYLKEFESFQEKKIAAVGFVYPHCLPKGPRPKNTLEEDTENGTAESE